MMLQGSPVAVCCCFQQEVCFSTGNLRESILRTENFLSSFLSYWNFCIPKTNPTGNIQGVKYKWNTLTEEKL